MCKKLVLFMIDIVSFNSILFYCDVVSIIFMFCERRIATIIWVYINVMHFIIYIDGLDIMYCSNQTIKTMYCAWPSIWYWTSTWIKEVELWKWLILFLTCAKHVHALIRLLSTRMNKFITRQTLGMTMKPRAWSRAYQQKHKWGGMCHGYNVHYGRSECVVPPHGLPYCLFRFHVCSKREFWDKTKQNFIPRQLLNCL